MNIKKIIYICIFYIAHLICSVTQAYSNTLEGCYCDLQKKLNEKSLICDEKAALMPLIKYLKKSLDISSDEYFDLIILLLEEVKSNEVSGKMIKDFSSRYNIPGIIILDSLKGKFEEMCNESFLERMSNDSSLENDYRDLMISLEKKSLEYRYSGKMKPSFNDPLRTFYPDVDWAKRGLPYKDCINPSKANFPIKYSSDSELSLGAYKFRVLDPKCTPEVLYNWTTPQVVYNYRQMWNNQSPDWKTPPYSSYGGVQANLFYGAFSPITTNDFGIDTVRVKLKEGTRFLIEDRPIKTKYGIQASYCMELPPEERKNTVFAWYRDNITNSTTGPHHTLEYDICDFETVHSWSHGLKEGYDELVKDYAWLKNDSVRKTIEKDKNHSAGYRHVIRNGKGKAVTEGIDNLSSKLMYKLDKIYKNAGEIFYNPSVPEDGKSVDKHFSYSKKFYWGPDKIDRKLDKLTSDKGFVLNRSYNVGDNAYFVSNDKDGKWEDSENELKVIDIDDKGHTAIEFVSGKFKGERFIIDSDSVRAKDGWSGAGNGPKAGDKVILFEDYKSEPLKGVITEVKDGVVFVEHNGKTIKIEDRRKLSLDKELSGRPSVGSEVSVMLDGLRDKKLTFYGIQPNGYAYVRSSDGFNFLVPSKSIAFTKGKFPIDLNYNEKVSLYLNEKDKKTGLIIKGFDDNGKIILWDEQKKEHVAHFPEEIINSKGIHKGPELREEVTLSGDSSYKVGIVKQVFGDKVIIQDEYGDTKTYNVSEVTKNVKELKGIKLNDSVTPEDNDGKLYHGKVERLFGNYAIVKTFDGKLHIFNINNVTKNVNELKGVKLHESINYLSSNGRFYEGKVARLFGDDVIVKRNDGELVVLKVGAVMKNVEELKGIKLKDTINYKSSNGSFYDGEVTELFGNYATIRTRDGSLNITNISSVMKNVQELKGIKLKDTVTYKTDRNTFVEGEVSELFGDNVAVIRPDGTLIVVDVNKVMKNVKERNGLKLNNAITYKDRDEKFYDGEVAGLFGDYATIKRSDGKLIVSKANNVMKMLKELKGIKLKDTVNYKGSDGRFYYGDVTELFGDYATVKRGDGSLSILDISNVMKNVKELQGIKVNNVVTYKTHDGKTSSGEVTELFGDYVTIKSSDGKVFVIKVNKVTKQTKGRSWFNRK